MSDGPAVSVLVATYRSPESLGRVIDAVLAQLAVDDEIVVVDDGSGDTTAAMLETLQDPRLTAIVQENRGVSAARNRAADAARNPLLVFLDDDEIPTSGWLEAHRRSHEQPGQVVMGRAELVVRAGRRSQVIPPAAIDDEDSAPSLLVNDSFSVLRAAFLAVDGFDERFVHGGEDIDLGLRLVAAGLDLALAPDAVIRHEIDRTYREFRRQRLRRGAASPILERAHGVALVATAESMTRKDRWWAILARSRAASEVVCLGLWGVLRAAGVVGVWPLQAAAAGRITFVLGLVGRARCIESATIRT